MTAPARALVGLSEISANYDAILCDLWGVVHNGVEPHPGAVEALVAFRRQGGRVVFITNSQRPSPPIVAMLDRIGVPRDAYDGIVSSGDATRPMIAPYRGQTVHHVGHTEAAASLFDGLGVTLGPVEAAAAVVVTELEGDDDRPDVYEDRLRAFLARGLPLICANPDKIVEIGDSFYYCAGALGDIYEAMGGMVLMAGKPYRPIYDLALGLAEQAAGRSFERSRIVAIGDAVRTDANGASQFGVDFIFVTGSIHAVELDAFGDTDPLKVADLVAPSGARLAGYLPRLVW